MGGKKRKIGTLISRGFRQKCPNCGQGKLFKTYLTPVDACTKCTEPFGHIEADDGPAWITMLVVSILVIPFFPILLKGGHYSGWTIVSLLVFLTLVLSYLFLPRFKGMFIALLWKNERDDAENK